MKKVISGNQACAEAVKLVEPKVIPVYPITPQTTISETLAQMVADGELNAELINVESEHSAMSACIGAQATGVRTYTATSSQGLCISPDAEVILENPGIENIKNIVERNLRNHKINHKSWEIGKGNGRVLTWNGQEFEYDELTHVQRIKSPSKLIKIITKSGSEVKVTLDHKILVDDLTGAEWVEAKDLKGTEYLYAPRKITIKLQKKPNLIEFLPKNMTLVIDAMTKNELIKKIKNIYGSINKCSEKLLIPKHHLLPNYAISLSTIKKLADIGIIKWEELCKKSHKFSLHGGTIKAAFTTINEELAYLLGLMSSDGYFDKTLKSKNRFVFTNKNEKLLEIFSDTYKKLFPGKPVGRLMLKNGITQLMGSNFIFSGVGKKITIREIFNYEENLIKAFLKGYFDGDGSCKIQSKKRITIFIHCKDHDKVSGLKKLLLRVGILSHVYKSNNITKGIYICGLYDTLMFIDNINCNHPEKQKRLMKARKFLSNSKPRPQWSGKAPLICRNLLLDAMKKNSCFINDIDPENYIHKTKSRNVRLGKEKVKEILKRIEKRGCKNNESIKLLKKFTSHSFFLDPIEKIEEIKSPYEYVYDISVKKNRSFVPNCAFVVSNCLMHEMLFVASGLRLPIVMGVANRALSSPLNIWNDQQDSFSQRDTGWIQLYVENAQEAFDTHIQAYKIAEAVKMPVMVCLDGYVVSHTYEPVEMIEKQKAKGFVGNYLPEVSLNPSKPVTMGPVATPEYYIYFRKQQQDAMEKAKKEIMKVNREFASMAGRAYGNGLLETICLDGKENALITIGSVAGTARAVLEKIENIGIIRVRSLRPFPAEELQKVCMGLKSVGILEKDVSVGANGSLYDEVKAALYGLEQKPKVSGFIAGLGGKDIKPEDIEVVMKKIKAGKEGVEWVL